MKNAISNLLVTSLLVSFSYSAVAADKIRVVKPPDKTKAQIAAEKDAAEKPAINGALMSILNQIVAAKLDANFRISSKNKMVNGEEKSVLDIKYLNVSALVKLKDEILIQFIDPAKANPQVKKIVPAVYFTTKDMTVIARMKIEEKGSLNVRFCQSYSVNNDVCNTFDDQKLLGVSLKSPTFGMLDIRIKDITGTFDKNILDGKIKFNIKCTVFKTVFDDSTAKMTNMKKVDDCSASGTFDSSKPNPFEYDINFVDKQ